MGEDSVTLAPASNAGCAGSDVGPSRGMSSPVVIDSNVQSSEDPYGQREDLSAVNHDVS